MRAKQIDELIKEELTPKTIQHWGTEHHNHVPVLVNKIHGDGGCLIAIVPLNTRPDYYIMRIDSSCKKMIEEDDEIRDLIEQEFLNDIEDQFGRHEWTDDNGETQYDPFPALNDECGWAWEKIK